MAAIPSYITAPMLGFVRAELIVNCFVVLFMLVVVGLRIYARTTGAGIGIDDMLILCSAPLGVAMLVCQGFLSPVGTGYDLADNMHFAVNAQFIFLMSFIMEIIYVLCLALSKASMLFFYRRVFSTPGMRKAIDIALVFLVAWAIAFECACIFLCTPVSYFWMRPQGDGTCGEFIPMIQSLIATNAVGDLIVMAMPMPIVWSLQMKKAEKIGIMSSFLLGLACIVIAVFRVIYLAKVDLASNITGTMATTVLLFALEPNLAILSVSIPMLRPLYASYRKRNNSSRLYDDKLNSGSNGLRTIGGGGPGVSQAAAVTGGPGGHHRSKYSKSDPLEDTVWEMDNYRPKAEMSATVVADAHSHSMLALSETNDDSSSEKSLTKKNGRAGAGHQQFQQQHQQMRNNPSNGGIGVKTTWTVTRNDS